MMNRAKTATAVRDTMEEAMANVVGDIVTRTMHGTEVRDYDDDVRYTLSVNGG